jgi:hypothetical protein
MCSASDNTALPVLGFPIRRSAGQRLFSASPRLIAAVHVLHRLLVPRHPPCALTILTVIFLGTPRRVRPVIPVYIGYCAVFKVREESSGSPTHPGPKGPLSVRRCRSLKTQQHATTPARGRCGCVQLRSTCLEPSALGAPAHAAGTRRCWPMRSPALGPSLRRAP